MRRAQRMIGTTAALLLAIGVVAAQAQPQFAGTWTLDRAQSQFPAWHGKSPDAQAQPPDVKLVVEQQSNTLKATRTVARGNRAHSMSETYVTDGTEQSFQGRHGTVVTRANFDGDRLVVTSTRTMQGAQGETTISRESIWSLSADGKTLTIDTKLETPRGERAIKSVYLRG